MVALGKESIERMFDDRAFTVPLEQSTLEPLGKRHRQRMGNFRDHAPNAGTFLLGRPSETHDAPARVIGGHGDCE